MIKSDLIQMLEDIPDDYEVGINDGGLFKDITLEVDEPNKKKKLLIALSGYYPHGVIVEIEGYGIHKLKGIDNGTISTDRGINYPLRLVKPFLRTMDSMTEKEKERYHELCDSYYGIYFDSINSIDWLNARKLDYRHLTDDGLAKVAKEGMYADAVNNAG